jgi:hypothetical protein
LHVVADVHTFVESVQALARHLDGTAPPVSTGSFEMPDRPADPARWRCSTMTGVQLPRSAIVEALLLGQVRRVVFDSAGVPVDVGRKRRFFTDAIRQALAIRTSRCVFAGCDQPLGRLQVDHTIDHQHGGTTAAHNAGLLCGHHNRTKNHGFTIWRDPNGLWHTYRPDGTEIQPL